MSTRRLVPERMESLRPAAVNARGVASVFLAALFLSAGALMAGWGVSSAHAANAPKFYLKKPPKGTPVDVLARTLIYDHDRDIATALGDVQIVWGPYLLLARKVVYNRRTDRFQAEGEVYLREPEGNVLVADFVNIDDKFREGFARHLRLLMTNGAELKARYAVRREGNITVYTDVKYTACKTCRLSSGEPLWEIRSKEATHDQQKGRIYHRNMTLNFAGAPVFWLPWISHPDPQHPRSTGFLVPSATYSEYRGFSVTTPYFINLAPNYDITLLPQTNSRQGLLARALWRHNVGSGIYEIDGGAIYQLQRDKMPSREQEKVRWFLKGKGTFDISSAWQWGFEGSVQSDRAMMRRYQVDSADVALSRLWLQGLEGRNFFLAQTGHYRGLNSTDNHSLDPSMLPWIQQEYTFSPAVLGGVLSLSSSFYSIWRQQNGAPFTTAALARRNTRLSAALNWQREWITAPGILFQPFAHLRGEVRAVKDLPDVSAPGNVYDSETIARFMPTAGLDVRWPFMASYEGGYQVLSPVLQIIAAPNESRRRKAGNEDSLAPRFTASSLFLHSRFPGADRHEGGVRMNAGLAWGLYADNGGFLRLSVGQTWHLAGRNSFSGSSTGLGTDRSDIVAGLAFTPGEGLLISWRGRFDKSSLKPRDQEAELDLTLRQLSLSLKYTRLAPYPEYGYTSSDKQVSGEAEVRFLDNWRVFGGLNYNVQKQTDWQAERYVGISFYCDCFNASLVYSEGVSSGVDTTFDRSISLNIELKTLGSSAVRSTGQ